METIENEGVKISFDIKSRNDWLKDNLPFGFHDDEFITEFIDVNVDDKIRLVGCVDRASTLKETTIIWVVVKSEGKEDKDASRTKKGAKSSKYSFWGIVGYVSSRVASTLGLGTYSVSAFNQEGI